MVEYVVIVFGCFIGIMTISGLAVFVFAIMQWNKRDDSDNDLHW